MNRINKNVKVVIESRCYHTNYYCVTHDIIATSYYFQRYAVDEGKKNRFL